MAEEQTPHVPPTPDGDVFISYASHDKAVAETVCKALEGAGLVCWIAPRDVVPGESFAGAIVHAIDGTQVVVLVLSEHSASSQHVLREVERASSRRHPVIPFRIDLAPMPADLEYFLNTAQWLDASTAGIKHALPRLVASVKIALTQSSSVPRVNPSAPSTARSRPGLRRAFVAAAAICVAAVAYVGADKLWLSNHRAAPKPAAGTSAIAANAKSIAVLPFTDMSEKHDQEYFSDGLSEELINHLAQITDLKVIARTSSFAFKGKNEDMRTIATKLGVANLLEGSVRKAGGKLRITAQLIRASDGVHMWSEIYDRKLDDIFKVQEEISTTVAKALNAALNASSASGTQPASKKTTNLEAYNLVLEGNYYYWRGNKGDDSKAIEYFRQAINLDPHYAAPWAMMARALAWQGSLGELTAAESELKGREAVERALAIDPNCADAYLARGQIFRFTVGDWTAAIAKFERAAALDPQGRVGQDAQDNILLLKGELSGRFSEYIDWARRRLVRDPLNTDTLFALGTSQQAAGLLRESAATFRRILELNPSMAGAPSQYGLTLMLMGKEAEALGEADKESDETLRLQALACIYWAMARRAESDSALAALERGFADRNAYLIAAARAFRGEIDTALEWLERAHQQRKGSLEPLKADILFRKLHGNRRFDAMLRKAKLME